MQKIRDLRSIRISRQVQDRHRTWRSSRHLDVNPTGIGSREADDLLFVFVLGEKILPIPISATDLRPSGSLPGPNVSGCPRRMGDEAPLAERSDDAQQQQQRGAKEGKRCERRSARLWAPVMARHEDLRNADLQSGQAFQHPLKVPIVRRQEAC
jgi:hypothetical protein